MLSKIQSASSFIKKMVKSPQAIGAVMPSGKKLCRAMVRAADINADDIVVEVGVGTGVVTRQLVAAGIPQKNLYLFENEASFIPELKVQFPDAHIIEGDAQFMQKHLTSLGVGKVSKIISSLPFKSLPKAVCANILEQYDMILRPNGHIIQFTYAVNEPFPRSFKTTAGINACRKAYVAQNVPPATVWVYSRTEI